MKFVVCVETGGLWDFSGDDLIIELLREAGVVRMVPRVDTAIGGEVESLLSLRESKGIIGTNQENRLSQCISSGGGGNF